MLLIPVLFNPVGHCCATLAYAYNHLRDSQSLISYYATNYKFICVIVMLAVLVHWRFLSKRIIILVRCTFLLERYMQ